MFIDREELDQLMTHKNKNKPVMSLYLNVTPPRDFAAELNSLLHRTRRRIEDSFDKEQLKGIDRVFEKIENYIRKDLGRPKQTRLLVIFADADGFWREYRLPVALPSRIVVERDAYTRPLTILLDEFERYCVLVCDSRKARIFSLYLGEFEEHPDVFMEDDVPDRVRAKRSRTMAGGNIQAGLGDDNIQHHIEDHIHRHLKKVADKTFRTFKKKESGRLILGGPEGKIRHQLKGHLHSYLSERLAGELRASPDDSDDELRQRALDVAQEFERNHEKALIKDLFEKSGPGGSGLLGVEPVIEALKMGQVQTLILDSDFKQEGYRCPNDKMLSTYLLKCPLCGEPMKKSGDLADQMVEEALSQNSEIEHVFVDHEDFKHYRAGALLRFNLA